jgi:hypothetical protein
LLWQVMLSKVSGIFLLPLLLLTFRFSKTEDLKSGIAKKWKK